LNDTIDLEKAVLRKYCGSNDTIVFFRTIVTRYYCVTTALLPRYPNVTLTLGVTASDVGYCPVTLSNVFVLGTLTTL